MPTPSGKPKVGERVRWRSPAWRVQPEAQWMEGTVVRRTDGDGWALKVRTDDGREQWILTAQYYLEHEALELVASRPKLELTDAEAEALLKVTVNGVASADDDDLRGIGLKTQAQRDAAERAHEKLRRYVEGRRH